MKTFEDPFHRGRAMDDLMQPVILLDKFHRNGGCWTTADGILAAAELRRLHEEVESYGTIIQYHEASIARLTALNQELLEVLVQICVQCRSNEWGPDTPRKAILRWFHDHASAALAKHGGSHD